MTGKPISDDSGGASTYAMEWAGWRVSVLLLGGEPGMTAEGLGLGLCEAFNRSPDLSRSARLGGPALALAAFAAPTEGRTGELPSLALPEPSWALSVGGAVRRALPTAARGTLTARTRLRQGVVEAQFGGEFAAAFSSCFDAVLVYGRSPEALVVQFASGADGPVAGVGIGPAPEGLGELGLSAREHALRGAMGDASSMLLVGPAAELGLPMANVASLSPPSAGAAPSFVGRGGLGHSIGASGVIALVVDAEIRASAEAGASETEAAESLRRRLLSSPRLLARDVGGTLELDGLRESQGRAGAAAPPPTAKATKHGCRGCPTPCGWTFDPSLPAASAAAADAAVHKTGGRFAALQGVLGESDGGLGFLAECNELGLDARTAAHLMVELQGNGEAFGGPRDFLDRASPAFARAMSLGPMTDVEPGATHHGADLSAQVGVHASARGPEPVRSLASLSFGAVNARELVAPLPWKESAAWDAGVLAYWHGCFSAAVDISGFCAFSAAGLLSDGVMGIEELASLLAPDGGWCSDVDVAQHQGVGVAMLAAGADHVARHRLLGGGRAADGMESSENPAGKVAMEQGAGADWAQALAGYDAARARGFRGIGPAGMGEERAGSSPSGESGARGTSGAAYPCDSPAAGPFLIRVSGILAAKLCQGAGPGAGAAQVIEWVPQAFPTTLKALLEELSAAYPSAGAWLIGPEGGVIPAAIAGGRRIAPGDIAPRGVEIELILAIPGG